MFLKIILLLVAVCAKSFSQTFQIPIIAERSANTKLAPDKSAPEDAFYSSRSFTVEKLSSTTALIKLVHDTKPIQIRVHFEMSEDDMPMPMNLKPEDLTEEVIEVIRKASKQIFEHPMDSFINFLKENDNKGSFILLFNRPKNFGFLNQDFQFRAIVLGKVTSGPQTSETKPTKPNLELKPFYVDRIEDAVRMTSSIEIQFGKLEFTPYSHSQAGFLVAPKPSPESTFGESTGNPIGFLWTSKKNNCSSYYFRH